MTPAQLLACADMFRAIHEREALDA